ncbi:MAG: hypothetical protein IJW00_06070 [Clostridia bacterium]|nr:hypothetical protein [Clostridia bacterium]
MMKRILALLLCLATLLTAFVGCAQEDEDYKGQYITAYLTDNVYDLDPAKAYKNEALSKIVGLMFDTLFTLDENGKVKKSLVKEYWTEENESAGEYKMYLRLKDTNWSDGTAVSANDIVFAWKRLLEVDADQEAAALLFDIKNARAAKEGDASIDDVAIYPSEQQLLEIQFEGKIDYDQFILNLTSLALAPLRDDIVSKSDDWAKKPGTMVCSGPFKLGRINWVVDHSTKYYDGTYSTINDDGFVEVGKEFSNQRVTDFILERNVYYYRDVEKDSLFKSVTPYRICVDCSLTDEQLVAMYDAGMIMYVGDIPMSLRKDSSLASDAVVAETSLSTNALYFNQNALINDGTEEGSALFANAKVRQALSMAIDRNAIAEAIVYAEAATGYIPTGVFDTAAKKKVSFRSACTTAYEYLKTDTSAAAALLSEAGVTPSKYTFSLTYAAYDEVHTYIAETIAAAWQALGFKVELNPRGTITNNDYYKYTNSTPEDICDDLYAQDLRLGHFEVVLLDSVAYAADAYSMLAPFAKAFSGQAMDMSNTDDYKLTPHITGYDSEKYNNIMEAVYFLQYYGQFNSPTGVRATTYFNQYESTELNAAAEKAMYETITAVYEEYGVSTAAKDYRASRAALLRAAEAVLMEDMAVVPVVFNLEATVVSSEIKGVTGTYYQPANFKEAKIKSYEDYLAAGKAYINANFDALAFNDADGCSYADFEAFKTANTIYAQYYLDEKEAVTLPPAEGGGA